MEMVTTPSGLSVPKEAIQSYTTNGNGVEETTYVQGGDSLYQKELSNDFKNYLLLRVAKHREISDFLKMKMYVEINRIAEEHGMGKEPGDIDLEKVPDFRIRVINQVYKIMKDIINIDGNMDRIKAEGSYEELVANNRFNSLVSSYGLDMVSLVESISNAERYNELKKALDSSIDRMPFPAVYGEVRTNISTMYLGNSEKAISLLEETLGRKPKDVDTGIREALEIAFSEYQALPEIALEKKVPSAARFYQITKLAPGKEIDKEIIEEAEKRAKTLDEIVLKGLFPKGALKKAA